MLAHGEIAVDKFEGKVYFKPYYSKKIQLFIDRFILFGWPLFRQAKLAETTIDLLMV